MRFSRVRSCARWSLRETAAERSVSLWAAAWRQIGRPWSPFAKWPRLLRRGDDFLFVIAGSCLPKGIYDHQVIAFGPVTEALLGKLYRAAHIVLAPLRSGTGTSLKVLEAFVYEKALVTSRIGVRGYAVGTEWNASFAMRFKVTRRSWFRFAQIRIACARLAKPAVRSSRPTTIVWFTNHTLNR